MIERQISDFEKRFGKRAVALACHAALPVVLNSELLHLIRINFFWDISEPLTYQDETNLLMSPLCQEIGEGLYEMVPALRDRLLQRLVIDYNQERVYQLAALLLEYSHHRAPWGDNLRLERAQELTALSVIDPSLAQNWLNKKEQEAGANSLEARDWFVAMRSDISRITTTIKNIKTTKRNPFIVGVPIQNPAEFYGREDVLRYIATRVDGVSAQSVSIVGARRMGKTSLLQQIVTRANLPVTSPYRLFQTNYHYVVFYVDLQIITSRADFMRQLRRYWQRSNLPTWDEANNDDLTILSYALEDMAEDYPNIRLVLCFDDFDIINQDSVEFDGLLEALRVEAQLGRLVLVTTSASSLKTLCQQGRRNISMFYTVFTQIELTFFSKAEWHKLVLDQFPQATVNDLAFIERCAKGHPYLTQLIASILWTHWPVTDYTYVEQQFRLNAKTHFYLPNSANEHQIFQPVENPFIVGIPVSGRLFVGREEIMGKLEESWGNNVAQNVNSIILFGNRRVGKTSILRNLREYPFKFKTLLVYFDMASVGRSDDTRKLVAQWAWTMYKTITDHGLAIAEPDPDWLSYAAFNRFLGQVKRLLWPDYRLIFTLDEFEVLEEKIKTGQIDPKVIEFLRGVIHSEPWFILVLAGLHTLEEMSRDYWHPLYASVSPIRVSFLSWQATAQLLGAPHEAFPLDITRDTIDTVYGLVRGQPYLTQLIGYSLVRRYNQQRFETGQERPPRFTPKDVQAVVSAAEFYATGSYYFNGLWSQAQRPPVGQTVVMQTLADANRPLSLAELQTTEDVLAVLQRHDIIQLIEGDKYDFTIPILRRWLREFKDK